MIFRAKVKYNGNHYFAGQEVSGSTLERRYIPNKGWTYWIYDDEPIEVFPYYGEGRYEWVEVDEATLEQVY